MSKSLQRSRQLAFNRQDGECFYCGLPMCLNGQSGPLLLRCTAEHLKARSEGGCDDPSNIVAACWHCNYTRHKCKHPLDPQRYRAKVRDRLERGAWFPSHVLTWANAPACSSPSSGAPAP